MQAKRHKKSRKYSSLRWILLATFIVMLIAFRFVDQIGPERFPEDRFIVVKVIDGDTVELLGGDRLRLLTIDTPEKGERLYHEAKMQLSNLAMNKQARIEFANKRRDKYGRLLGYLYIDDTIFVNLMMIRAGLASVYLFKDTDIEREETRLLIQGQREAISEKVGIWSMDPIPEDYYIAVKNSYRFHRPGCKSISRSKLSNQIRFENRLEPYYDGLSGCRRCKP